MDEKFEKKILNMEKANKALKESEQRYRELVDNANCAVIVIEPTGYLSFINPKFCEMMGYTMEEVKKLHLSKLVHPEDSAMVTENFKKKLSGQQTPKSYKVRALTKPGDTIYVDYESSVIKRKGRIVGIQAVISDISERKKAEEEVRESEGKYRMLFQDANDVILYVNKYGKIIDINKRVEDIFGYTRDEVVGKNFVELGVLRPKNIPRIVKLFRDSIGDKEVISILELEVKNKKGKMVPIEASTRVIKRNGKIVGTMNILRDISKRKKAEEEIKAKSQFLESLIGQSPLPTFVIDSVGVVVMVNKAFLKAYNVPKKEMVLGMNALTEPANVRQGVVKYIKEALSGKIVETPEIEFISPYENKKTVTKSRLFPIFDTANRLTNVVVMHEDITERKKAEDKIEALSRFPSENPNPVLRIATDERILYTNDPAKEVFKVQVGKKMPERYLPILKKATSSKEYVSFEEEVGRRYFSSVIRAVPKTGYLNMYSRDITERKKAEKALIQSERLRALGEMAGGVAHDFNNLLAIILGNAQLLEGGLERYGEEEIKGRLAIIARTASQGGETVRRLQRFTHREISSDEFTRLDLNEIVRSALRSTSPRWKDEAEAEGVTITIKEKLEKLPPLLGSRSELMEVLTNLIFNAVEAMPEGGRITIKSEAKENEVHLYFTDTGKGIPDKIKTNIFDPFFTTKGPKASGLGLSTSYGVIKRHKGDMKVESSERKGTTFSITIPIPSEIPLKKEEFKPPEKVPSQRILVIDDEEGVRDVLARILGEEGHQVTLAETGKKGLDKFKQGDFDLVLTDLGMPEMSGWELARRIKKINPSLPVGLITGWAASVSKERMKEEGVAFILSKPFDRTKVVIEVNAVLKSKNR